MNNFESNFNPLSLDEYLVILRFLDKKSKDQLALTSVYMNKIVEQAFDRQILHFFNPNKGSIKQKLIYQISLITPNLIAPKMKRFRFSFEDLKIIMSPEWLKYLPAKIHSEKNFYFAVRKFCSYASQIEPNSLEEKIILEFLKIVGCKSNSAQELIPFNWRKDSNIKNLLEDTITFTSLAQQIWFLYKLSKEVTLDDERKVLLKEYKNQLLRMLDRSTIRDYPHICDPEKNVFMKLFVIDSGFKIFLKHPKKLILSIVKYHKTPFELCNFFDSLPQNKRKDEEIMDAFMKTDLRTIEFFFPYIDEATAEKKFLSLPLVLQANSHMQESLNVAHPNLIGKLGITLTSV